MSRPVTLIGSALDCDSLTTQDTFVVINHEILSTVLRTVPLLWHVQKFHFLAKVNATSPGQLLDSLLRNDAAVGLCPGEFNEAYCRDPE
jgi:hypothetical protein